MISSWWIQPCDPFHPSLGSFEDTSLAQIYCVNLNSVIFFFPSFVITYSLFSLFQSFCILFFSVSFLSCFLFPLCLPSSSVFLWISSSLSFSFCLLLCLTTTFFLLCLLSFSFDFLCLSSTFSFSFCLNLSVVYFLLCLSSTTLKKETFAISRFFAKIAESWNPRKFLKHSIRESLFSQNILKLVIFES